MHVAVLSEVQANQFSFALFEQHGRYVELVVFPLSDTAFSVVADRKGRYAKGTKLTDKELCDYLRGL